MENHDTSQLALEVPFPPKSPIKCILSAKATDDLSWVKSSLIFTHGAGGTLQADAVANFTYGFVSAVNKPTMVGFEGNMNLASRVKMFSTVIQARSSAFEKKVHCKPACLGGRSMGARAAVKAITEDTTHLVLASYPLHTNKQVRDQILLDLPPSMRVIFVSGDRDEMCDLERLEVVRTKMKCKTWRIVVRGADHGMNVKPKSGTREVGRMAGALVATWLNSCDETLREGNISWNSADLASQWSGWYDSNNSSRSFDDDGGVEKADETPVVPAQNGGKSSKRKTKEDFVERKESEEVSQPEPKRGRKR